MKRVASLMTLAFVFAACEAPTALDDSGTQPVSAVANAVTTNIDEPLGPVLNPCNGDVIFFSPAARIHIKFSTTFDANGGFHSTFHFQPKNAHGVGDPSGISYNGVGITRGTFNDRSPPGPDGSLNETFVNNFRMIAKANGPSFHVHQTFHITFDANGNVTALVDEPPRTTCG